MTFGIILLLFLTIVTPSIINKIVLSKRRTLNIKLLSDSRKEFSKNESRVFNAEFALNFIKNLEET